MQYQDFVPELYNMSSFGGKCITSEKPSEENLRTFYNEQVNSNNGRMFGYYYLSNEDMNKYSWFRKYHYNYCSSFRADFSSDTMTGLRTKMLFILPVMKVCSSLIWILRLLTNSLT